MSISLLMLPMWHVNFDLFQFMSVHVVISHDFIIFIIEKSNPTDNI